MTRKDVLLKTWHIANERESWFAPVRKALESVNANQALWKPAGVEGFNSILEITHHLLYYKLRFLARLKETDFDQLASNEATFVAGLSMDWDKVRDELFNANKQIEDYLQGLEENALDTPKPKAAIGQQVLDLATHDAYHSGQIVLIRKLQGSW